MPLTTSNSTSVRAVQSCFSVVTKMSFWIEIRMVVERSCMTDSGSQRQMLDIWHNKGGHCLSVTFDRKAGGSSCLCCVLFLIWEEW